MSEQKERSPVFWLLIAVLAHGGWGSYPVFGRYLQTVSHLPALSLLAMGNLVVLLIMGVGWLPGLDKRPLAQPGLWLFGGIVILRGVTNLFAARYTLSVYVQLINQMTPFIVALLSLAVLREPLPRYLGRALTLCLLGAILMLGSDVGQITMVGTIRNDLWGLLLAAVSSVFLAVYMIMVKRTVNRYQVGSEHLMFVHWVSLFSFALIGSLVSGEQWAQWGQLRLSDWLVFAAFSLGSLLFANLAQIQSIRQLGAPVVSSFMALRLVVALLVGAVLLGERLESVWQFLGAAIVLVTITWYLQQQALSTAASSVRTDGREDGLPAKIGD